MSAETAQPEILGLLSNLRGQIRKYVVLEGIAVGIVMITVLFWVTFGIDLGWFEISRLELPIWLRTALIVAGVVAIIVRFFARAIGRLVNEYSPKGLALVLERRFPQLNDGLVTSVEMSADPKSSALTQAMLSRTAQDAAGRTDGLDLTDVFERGPLMRSMSVAGVMAASIVLLSVTNADAVERWWRAFVVRDAIYWERETQLVVKAVVQPGDRVREFEDVGNAFVIKHARGADLSLVIKTPDGSRPDGGEWQTPGRVRLDIVRADRSRSRVYVTPTDGEFRYGISQLQDSVDLTLQGGDFATRKPYRVEVVDPPRIEAVEIQPDYPDYTGLDDPDDADATIDIVESQISLPMETSMRLKIRPNKPLVGFRILADQFQIHSDGESMRLVVEADDDAERAAAEIPIHNVTKLTNEFVVPFRITQSVDELMKSLPSTGIDIVPTGPDTVLRVYLEDVDGIVSADPTRLIVSGVADTSPVIQTRLRGIGTSITRKAVIPIVGTVTDDFGIVKSRFDFRVDDAEEWRPRAFRNRPSDVVREFVLQRSDDEAFEQFEVLPLDLSVGRKLALTVFAEDGDNLNGPHDSRGETYIFTIVSNEELLSILYGREVNLRRRFEQTVQEVEDTRADLLSHRERYEDEAAADPDGEAMTSVAACAARTLNGIRKNANETASVADGFRDIRDELINNRVLASDIVERVDQSIVLPLDRLVQIDFPEVDGSLGLFKRDMDQTQSPLAHIDAGVSSIDGMLAQMREILDKMEDLRKIHEVFNILKGIIDEQENLKDEAEDIQTKRLKDRLKAFE